MKQVDQTLYDAANDFIDQRFKGKAGYKGAAAMYTETGRILISTAPDTHNDSVSLCHETGALCEAHKLNEQITASICISRTPEGKNYVLSPCGVCQERLFLYGGDIHVAIPDGNNPSKFTSKPLKEVQPYYWRKALEDT